MNKFANIVVHLNEDNIEEVKELLLSKGFKILESTFNLSDNKRYNFLYFDTNVGYFKSSYKEYTDKEITLEEFKRLINEK